MGGVVYFVFERVDVGVGEVEGVEVDDKVGECQEGEGEKD